MFKPTAYEYITRRIADLDEQLAEWAEKFKTDPMYALEWAERVAEVASEREVYQVLEQYARERPTQTTCADVTRLLEDRMHRAMQEVNSTSAFSNATNMIRMNVIRRTIHSPFGGGLHSYFEKEAE